MSGGFFRGTSADQDTRFSNKQAKLLKSQKFAPELENLVDMTKVKMDVIKPWIATRATELLGFEDEVLINFIYGLLDGKDVDGKQIQIQLTGFMEKNTGKFMRELWALLLSAQKNASGIPQQFLDAKAEESRKKKEESDRITLEIQRKKEKEGRDHESTRKLDGATDVSRVANFSDGDLKKSLTAPGEERGMDERNGSERRIRLSLSPESVGGSPAHRNTPSPIRSSSKSMSHSRSYSGERQKSRSISRSPPRRRRSISPGRHYHSMHKQSLSPHRRQTPRSPKSRRVSPHSRFRSLAPRWRRSPSPRRRRSPSPRRHRSPSPRRRRSPSPRRRRSPSLRRHRPSPRRHRSPSPRRHRSPSLRRNRSPSLRRHRSPSPRRIGSPSLRRLISPSPRRRRSPPPNRRRSPPNRQRSPSPLGETNHSPIRRRSPPARRSPSPFTRSPSPRWRSPIPSRLHSPSPLTRRSPLPRSPRQRRRSPVRSSPRLAADSQSPQLKNNGSQSPYRSPVAHRNGRSLSSDLDDQANGATFRKSQNDFASRRIQQKRSSVSPPPSSLVERDDAEQSGSVRKGQNSRKAQISLRSPQRDPRELHGPYKGSGPERSPRLTCSRPSKRKESPVADRSSSESPFKQPGKRTVHHYSPVSSKEEIDIRHGRGDSGHGPVALRKKASSLPMLLEKKRPVVDSGDDEDSLGREPTRRPEVSPRRSNETSQRKVSPERRSQQTRHLSEGIEYRPGRPGKESLDQVHDERPLARHNVKSSYSSDVKLNTGHINPSESYGEGYRVPGKQSSTATNDEYGGRDKKAIEKQKSVKMMSHNDGVDSYESDSDEKETSRSHKIEKRKYKKMESNVDDDEYDSQKGERKEAKRRRKEEKRLRKEEKRRRREERRRRKEERRAGKLKTKHVDTVTPPSDVERKQNHSGETDDDVDHRMAIHTSDSEGREMDEKKLEIELRNKALESLRAKKAISH